MSASPMSELFGGGSGGFYEQELITESKVFVAPNPGWYFLTATSGGQSGGKVNGSASVLGGNAGGISKKLVWLNKGAELTCTVGAGGAPVTTPLTSSNPGLPGNAGGTTTVVGPGVNIEITGGSSAGGGVASGGDVNYPGGTTTSSGGASVPVYGVIVENNSTSGAGCSTSGIDNLGGGDSLPQGSGGGGGFGAGRLNLPIGSGGKSTHADLRGVLSDGGPGGGGASGFDNASAWYFPGKGGMFAGGGSGIPRSSGGGAGGLGGGGGGAARSTGASPSGVGGSGIVIIEFYRTGQ